MIKINSKIDICWYLASTIYSILRKATFAVCLQLPFYLVAASLPTGCSFPSNQLQLTFLPVASSLPSGCRFPSTHLQLPFLPVALPFYPFAGSFPPGQLSWLPGAASIPTSSSFFSSRLQLPFLLVAASPPPCCSFPSSRLHELTIASCRFYLYDLRRESSKHLPNFTCWFLFVRNVLTEGVVKAFPILIFLPGLIM
jgi:hypothetical protein